MSECNWQVPRFNVTEFHPLRTRYCVCVFVINEGERIREQLHRMKSWASLVDIIVADGGSSDGSLEPSYLRDVDVRALLVKIESGGLSAQMRMALSYCLEQGYQGVIVMDGNNKDDPSALATFVRTLDEGYDHVQGSRFIKEGKALNTPLSRLLAVKLIHAPLLSLAAQYRYTDTTNGFRAYSERLLRDPRVAVFRNIFSAYELHYYLAVRAPRLGYKVTEIPVTRSYPAKGIVPTKISYLKGNFRILMTLIRACLFMFDPKPRTN